MFACLSIFHAPSPPADARAFQVGDERWQSVSSPAAGICPRGRHDVVPPWDARWRDRFHPVRCRYCAAGAPLESTAPLKEPALPLFGNGAEQDLGSAFVMLPDFGKTNFPKRNLHPLRHQQKGIT